MSHNQTIRRLSFSTKYNVTNLSKSPSSTNIVKILRLSPETTPTRK